MDYRTYKMKTFAEKPEVRAEYEQLGPQYEAICAAIESRKAAGLTQKQLAEKMGTAQANISRFENGNSNPSLGALGKTVNFGGSQVYVPGFTGARCFRLRSTCLASPIRGGGKAVRL